MLFGASYVLTRLIFDFLLTQEYIAARPETSVSAKVMALLKFLLHIKFFSDWVNQQIRLRKRNTQASVQTKEAVTIADSTVIVAVEKIRLMASEFTSELSSIDKQEAKKVLESQPIWVEKQQPQRQGGRATKQVIVSTFSVQESITTAAQISPSSTGRRSGRIAKRAKVDSTTTLTPTNRFMEDHVAQKPVAVR